MTLYCKHCGRVPTTRDGSRAIPSAVNCELGREGCLPQCNKAQTPKPPAMPPQQAACLAAIRGGAVATREVLVVAGGNSTAVYECLSRLVERGLVVRSRVGREWRYSVPGKLA